MKKQIRLFALVLILAMCLTAIGGCTGQQPPQTSTPDESSESTQQSETTQPAGEAPAQSTGEVPSSPEGDSPLAQNEQELELSKWGATSIIQYPIAQPGTVLTFWNPLQRNMEGIIESQRDLMMLSPLAEATGITLEIRECSDSTSNEQFNLMIASGDHADLLKAGQYYNGGVIQAYEDGVIIDLTDMIPELAPDFEYVMDHYGDNTRKLLTSDDGMILQVYAISEYWTYTSGLAVRKDWIDKLGIQVPETIDELFDVLTAFKTEMGAEEPLCVNADGILNMVTGAFNIEEFAVGGTVMPGGTTGGIGMFQEDGVARCTLTEDNYYEYLEYFLKLRRAGLINPDFFSADPSPIGGYGKQASGVNGIWRGNNDSWNTLKSMTDDPDYDLIGIKPIVKNKGDQYKFGQTNSVLGMNAIAISATCTIPETALKFLNYFYTAEGYLIVNYGEEGLSYEFDNDGMPVLTDLVLHNPNGWGIPFASQYYTIGMIAGLTNNRRFWPGYSDAEIDALKKWSEASTGVNCLPAVTLTTAESSRYTTLSNDIKTYATETVLKWLSEAEELNNSAWNDFQTQLKAMGIEECIGYYQNALERYSAR